MDWSTVALFSVLALIAAVMFGVSIFYRIVMRIIRVGARSTHRTVAAVKNVPYRRR